MTDSVESVLQKSREEFEKWTSGQVWAEPGETKRDDIGRYKYSDVDYGWKAWQASRSALEPMLAELNDLRHQIEYAQGTIGGNPGIYVHDKIYHLKNRAEAAEQALREAQSAAKEAGYGSGSLVSVIESLVTLSANARQESEKLRELLREAMEGQIERYI